MNCAAVTKRFPAIDFPEAEWDRRHRRQSQGTFLRCQAFGRKMVAQKTGKIVNFVSIAGLAGHSNSAAYQACKGVVVQLTRVLAVEWAPHHVCANAIPPLIVMTPSRRCAPGSGPPVF